MCCYVKYTGAGKYETLTTLGCSGMKRLLTSWLLFFDTRRERHNFYYADCTIWPNKCAAHPIATSWTGPAQSQILCNFFFKITKFSAHRFRAWRHSHPSHISSLGFLLWHLWLSYPLRSSVNCTQYVFLCTRSRIVQSPTKPKDKI